MSPCPMRSTIPSPCFVQQPEHAGRFADAGWNGCGWLVRWEVPDPNGAGHTYYSSDGVRQWAGAATFF